MVVPVGFGATVPVGLGAVAGVVGAPAGGVTTGDVGVAVASGALVGGASLDAAVFASIVQKASA